MSHTLRHLLAMVGRPDGVAEREVDPMKVTTAVIDELVSLVCDHLCHYPYVITDQDELDEKCESCPLVARLMKEVEE